MRLLSVDKAIKHQSYLFISMIGMIIGQAIKLSVEKSSSIQMIISFLLLASFVGVLYNNKKFRYLSLFLLPVLILYTYNGSGQVPFVVMLLENTIKLLVPITFVGLVAIDKQYHVFFKLAIALTFTSHGLLAMNVLNTPDSFYFMTQKILHLDINQARIFLFAVGFIDIIVSITMFLPNKKIAISALYYCVFWGGVTALARTLTWWDGALEVMVVKGFAETLVRIPNALLPLFLIKIYNVNK